MSHECPVSGWQRAAVILAALSGLLAIIAGGQVLLGWRTPDHAVLMPLLLFNVVMGAVSIAVAFFLIRRDARAGRRAAALIALLNAGVWVLLGISAFAGAAVAGDSIVAMTLRTVLWGSIYLMLGRAAPAPGMEAA